MKMFSSGAMPEKEDKAQKQSKEKEKMDVEAPRALREEVVEEFPMSAEDSKSLLRRARGNRLCP